MLRHILRPACCLRRRWLLMKMAAAVFAACIVVINVFFITDVVDTEERIPETDSEYTKELPEDFTSLRMQKRLEMVHTYCRNNRGSGEVGPGGATVDFRREVLIAENHGLLLCPVAKAASTFLTRLLIALEETSLALSPFLIPPEKALRLRAKYSGYRTLKELRNAQREKEFLNKLTRVLFVRHPLWRLWSLYVDKLVFPNPFYWQVWGLPAQRHAAGLSEGRLSGTNSTASASALRGQSSLNAFSNVRMIRPVETRRNKSGTWQAAAFSFDPRMKSHFHHPNQSRGDLQDCGQNVDFGEFLSFVLDDLHRTDWHVRPVWAQCHPCDVNYTVVGHVVSLEPDVRYLLRALRSPEVTLAKLDWTDEMVRDAITDGVDSLFNKWFPEATRCVSAELAARRLWATFQLRGFISHTAAYPFEGHDERNLTARMLEQAALAARSQSGNPLALRRQKTLAFRRAVQAVDQSVLSRLADIYSADFTMFGFTLESSLNGE